MSTKKELSAAMKMAESLIKNAILTRFPPEYIDIVFSGALRMDDVVEMILLDTIRNVYDIVSPKNSLRYYLGGPESGSDNGLYMLYSRYMSYIMKYRKYEYDRRADMHGVTSKMEALLSTDMSDMQNKIDGYQLNEMQFFEIKTMIDNEFTKAVTEHRITNSKKVSNKRFREIMDQYDSVIGGLQEDKDKDDESMIFNTIAAFVLEWKYPVHFLYSIASKMEEMGISGFADERMRLALLCADVSGISWLGNSFSTHSRMITVRDKYIDLILKEPLESETFEMCKEIYGQGLNIVALIRTDKQLIDDREPLDDWFIKNTDEHDWATFCRKYSIFETISAEKKVWTDRKIKYFRKLCELILVEPAKEVS